VQDPTAPPLQQARQALAELRYYRNRRSRTPQGVDRRETAAWEALLGALEEIDTRLRALEGTDPAG
jgi:hypothetical protein